MRWKRYTLLLVVMLFPSAMIGITMSYQHSVLIQARADGELWRRRCEQLERRNRHVDTSGLDEISKALLSLVHVGDTRKAVEAIFGTPMIEDPPGTCLYQLNVEVTYSDGIVTTVGIMEPPEQIQGKPLRTNDIDNGTF